MIYAKINNGCDGIMIVHAVFERVVCKKIICDSFSLTRIYPADFSQIMREYTADLNKELEDALIEHLDNLVYQLERMASCSMRTSKLVVFPITQ